MIRVGRLNESVDNGLTLEYFLEQSPDQWGDDDVLQNIIKSFDEVAKVLKCNKRDLVLYDEEEGRDIIAATHKKGATEINDSKAKSIGPKYFEGHSGLWERNGVRYITINSWGFAQTFCTKADAKKLLKMNESVESSAPEMSEAGPGGYNSKKGPGGSPKCPKCKSDMVAWRGPGSKAECEDCGYEWTPWATNESINEAAGASKIILSSSSKELPPKVYDQLILDCDFQVIPKSEDFPMPWDADLEIKSSNLILTGHAGPSGFGKSITTIPLNRVEKSLDFTAHGVSEELVAKLADYGWLVK